MAVRFVIVDDDINIRKIIKNIVIQYKLGTIVAESGDGLEAEKFLCAYQPDIALVDLLLPSQDGVQLLEKTRETCEHTSFIMISQVSSDPLITQAYQSGIEFFIHKPLNVLEVVSVIHKVQEKRRLEQIMSFIGRTTAAYTSSLLPCANQQEETSRKKKIYTAFSDLGILGETGTQDIYKLSQLIRSHMGEEASEKYQLLAFYDLLAEQLHEDARTIKQRVRRAITRALQNLASLGAEDYYNETFQQYSMALFDFQEVRVEMDFVNHKGQYHGKINVKKFMEGLLFLTN